MNGLLGNIPGLAAHQIQIPTAKLPFDHEKAVRLVSDAVGLLNSFYPAGALEWIQVNRPDIPRYLKESEAALDQSIENGDQEAFAKALDLYTERHRRAFTIYNERPPVIEVQEEMFNG